MDRTKNKKIIEILKLILSSVFMVFAIMCIFLSVKSKTTSDGCITLFGNQARIVLSNSMERCDRTYDRISQYKIKDIPINSLVFIETVPEDTEQSYEWFSQIQLGDVLTFRYMETIQVTITHRVVAIESTDNAFIFTLQGDNWGKSGVAATQIIDTSNQESGFNYIIGKVTSCNVVLGQFIVAIKNPVVIVLFVIVPGFIIIAYEVLKYFLTRNKKMQTNKKIELELKVVSKEREIEKLKNELNRIKKDKGGIDTKN